MVPVGFRRSLIDDGSLFVLVPVIAVFTKYDRLVDEVSFGNNLEFMRRTKTLDPDTGGKKG